MIKLLVKADTWEELDVTDNISIPITKTFEDLQNPTVINNDWSKTVSLPRTQKNIAILGDLFNIDRRNFSYVGREGVFFNVNSTVDIRLEWNDIVLLEGYGKITSITDHINMSLYGNPGKILKILQKCTYTDYTSEYYIDTKPYYSELLTKELLAGGLNHPTNLLKLRKKTDTDYDKYSVINFTLSNGIPEQFDSTSYTGRDTITHKISEIFEGIENYQEKSGYSPECVGDLITPLSAKDFMVQNQIPYIYVNKLFQITIDTLQELSGTKIELDDSFFNAYNDFWTSTVLTLKHPNEVTQKNRGETVTVYNNADFYNVTLDFNTVPMQPLYKNLSNLPKTPYTVQMTVSFLPQYISKGSVVSLAPWAKRFWDINTRGKNDGDTNIYGDIEQGEGNIDEVVAQSTTVTLTCTFSLTYLLYTKETDPYDNFSILGDFHFLSDSDTSKSPFLVNGVETPFVRVKFNSLKETSSDKSFEKFYVDFNTLCNSDFTPIKFITDYCKMFNLLLIEDNNKLKIVPRAKYFENYTVTDWSDKINYAKGTQIQYMSNINTKNLILQESSGEDYLSKNYKGQTGYSYGYLKLLNTDSSEDEIQTFIFKSPVNYSPFYLNFDLASKSDKPSVKYYTTTGQFLCDVNDKNSQVTSFGYLCFENKYVVFGNDYANLTYTEASSKMNQTTLFTFFYPTQTGGVEVSNMIGLGLVGISNHILSLGTPDITYDSFSGISGKNIYEIFWEDYINERYNTQNKQLTCWVNLRLEDWQSFKFNNFVKIKNQLYMINKIYDYNVNQPFTKVDLITVSDIEAYYKLNLELPHLTITQDGKPLPSELHYKAGDTDTWYLSSSSDWSWDDVDSSLQEFFINDLNGRGSGKAGNNIKLNITIDPRCSPGVSGLFRFTNNNGLSVGTEIYID